LLITASTGKSKRFMCNRDEATLARG
jgi:hypothetical protein